MAHGPVDPLAEKLVRAGRGDEDAFAGLYDATVPRVFGLALHMTGDLDQAQEVSHKAFVDIWREAPRFDPDRGSAIAWMISVAHRRAVETVRSTRGTVRRKDAPHAESRSVLESLAGLTADQRRAVELAYLDGHTYVDVAGLMREQTDDTLSQMGAALRSLCPQT